MSNPNRGGRYYQVNGKRLSETEYQAELARQQKPQSKKTAPTKETEQ